MPLIWEDRTYGILAVCCHEHLGDQDAQQLALFARRVAGLLVQAQSAEGLRRKMHRLDRENSCLHKEIEDAQPFERLVGTSPAVRELRRRIDELANQASPVLIAGPPGVGKELIAHLIHARSRRADRPLLKIHCGDLSASAIDLALFGHTDKKELLGCPPRSQVGRIEMSFEGTLFVKALHRMPIQVQKKLHAAMESGGHSRAGEDVRIRFETRLIASTSWDPTPGAGTEEFEEHLFGALSKCVLRVSALKDRTEDIFLLAEHYVHFSLNADTKSE